MTYYELIIHSSEPFAYDILTAALAEAGFESFDDSDGSLKAYIPENLYNKALVDETLAEYADHFMFTWTVNEIAYQNWNAVWESNFQPIEVGKSLRVRALFHQPDPSYPLELVIQPKMSFGTGHHATTWLVMDAMLGMEWKGKKVMDFGTGTGILAILAHKLGAAEVWAVDYDPQCVENSLENLALNHSEEIHVSEGNINAFEGLRYDVVIGNITRNVIIEFLEDISSKLQNSGWFIASGFYEEDVPLLAQHAEKYSLELLKTNVKDKWCMAIFRKKGN